MSNIRRKKIGIESRKALALETKYRCAHCGVDLSGEHFVYHSVDHVIPLALKGADKPTNEVLLCKLCNSFKGARMVRPQKFFPFLNSKTKRKALKRAFDLRLTHEGSFILDHLIPEEEIIWYDNLIKLRDAIKGGTLYESPSTLKFFKSLIKDRREGRLPSPCKAVSKNVVSSSTINLYQKGVLPAVQRIYKFRLQPEYIAGYYDIEKVVDIFEVKKDRTYQVKDYLISKYDIYSVFALSKRVESDPKFARNFSKVLGIPEKRVKKILSCLHFVTI